MDERQTWWSRCPRVVTRREVTPGVPCEQQAEKCERELDEHGLDEGEDELGPGRRGEDVEPGIDEQKRRRRRRRTLRATASAARP
jgi:hypothetical protein